MRVCVANTVNKCYLGAVFNLYSKAPKIEKAKGIKKLSQNNLPFQPSASPSLNTYTHATHPVRQFKNTLTEIPHMLFNPFRCHSLTHTCEGLEMFREEVERSNECGGRAGKPVYFRHLIVVVSTYRKRMYILDSISTPFRI